MIENPKIGKRIMVVADYEPHWATLKEISPYNRADRYWVVREEDEYGWWAARDELFATPTEAAAALEEQADQLRERARELRETDT